MKSVTGAVSKSIKAVGNTLDKVNPIKLFRMSDKAKYVIVMIRHAESEWNQKDLFCGWYDAELTKKGKEEAAYAGKILKESGFKFNEAHTSVLKRCNDTLEIILKEIEHTDIPVARSWRLNERHYGCLTGLPRSKANEKYTEEQIQIWRRSFDVAPPPMEKDHPYYKQIVEDPRYYTEPKKNDFPMTESLKLTIARTLTYWNDIIVPKIKEGKLLLIVGHTNSLRAIIKHLDRVEEAASAGKALKKAGFKFDEAHTSVLKRAQVTLDTILKVIDQTKIPIHKTWRLNERHYGGLTGLNKSETAEKYGEDQVKIWRRSFDVPPPPMEPDHKYYREIVEDPRYAEGPQKEAFPMFESLKLTIERTLPYWNDTIVPKIKEGKTILIAAHGNSLRGIVKHLDNLSNDEIMSLNLPTGIPFVYELDADLKPVVSMKFLGDEETVRKAMESVAAQGKAKK